MTLDATARGIGLAATSLAYNTNGAQITVTPPVTVASYAAGNVIGGVMAFQGVLSPSFNGVLSSIVVKFKGTLQTGNFALALFTANPTGTFTDKTAPAIAAADTANLVGIYTLGGGLSILGTHTIYNLDGISKEIVGVSTWLWGVLITSGVPTNPASTSDLSVSLGTLW